MINRDTEAHFFASFNVFGNQPAECFTEHFLGVLQRLFHFNRHACGKFDDMVIKQRTAAFQRRSHAGDVHLGKYIAGQIRLEIGGGGACHKVALGISLIGIRDTVRGIVMLSQRPEFGRDQPFQTRRTEDCNPVQVSAFRILRQRFQQTFQPATEGSMCNRCRQSRNHG